MNTAAFPATVLKIIALACFAALLGSICPPANAEPAPGATDAAGTFHVPAFDLPESSLLDDKTRAVLKDERDRQKAAEPFAAHCPKKEGADRARMREVRLCEAEAFYKLPFYQKLRAQYPVTLTPQTLGGVYAEVFTPAGGIPEKNPQRVLINLHGGGFQDGSRTSSHLESIPIASLGQITVISVDYRQGPEYQFPAASEDVEGVYRELLKTYKPENIGVYGCSAGGLLTAEITAWLQRKGLPRPGAVGMLCATGLYYGEGDSGNLVAARLGFPLSAITVPQGSPYFREASSHDPLAFPMRFDEVMAAFPPSLLITSTRDQGLSSVVYAHSRLVALGVEAQLHVWEGLDHAFFTDPSLPQSREVHEVTVKFFERHLGQPSQPSKAGNVF